MIMSSSRKMGAVVLFAAMVLSGAANAAVHHQDNSSHISPDRAAMARAADEFSPDGSTGNPGPTDPTSPS
jgi:hypothetical protein